MQKNIKKEIEQIWESIAGEKYPISSEMHDFSCIINEFEESAIGHALQMLQPWIAILEQGIQWLACLHASLDSAVNRRSGDQVCYALDALIGTAVSHAVAIRRLCLSGLDSTAKIVLRVMAETFSVCIAILWNSELRRNFTKPQSLEQAQDFWFKYFARGKLEKILENAEASILGLDDEIRNELRDCRKEQVKWLSQYVHPSYVAAILTAMPQAIAEPGMHRIGTLGLCNSASIGTLDATNKAIWYFSRVGCHLMFRETKQPFHVIDPNDEIDRLVVLGREVLHVLVSRHWYDHKEKLDKYLL